MPVGKAFLVNIKVRRRLFKLLTLGMTALALLVMTSVALLHTPWMQREIIRLGLQRIERRADVRIEVGNCRLSPLSVIYIESLRVLSGGREFILSDKVELAYRLRLTWPYLVPRVIFFDQPVIYLEKDDQGHWRIPRAATVTPHHRVARDVGTHRHDFSWPEVRVRSGRIIALQNGEKVLSLQNLDGTLPYRVVEVAGEPAFIIDFGQWR